MAISFRIIQGSALRDPNSTNVVLRAGICTGGAANDVFEFAPGQDPTPAAGYGPAIDCAAQASRLAAAYQYFVKVPATIAGTIGAVAKSPSNGSPLIVVEGSAFDGLTNTPWDAYKLRVKVIQAGVLGVARVAVALDGAQFNLGYDVPEESQATVIGVMDLTALTLGDLNGRPLKIDGDAGPLVTVNFTTPSSIADIAVQINAAATLAGGQVTADIVAGRHLRVRSNTVGAASALELDQTAAAFALLINEVVPLAPLTASGSASIVTIAGTGLKITFPSGTYEINTLYSSNTTAPRHSLGGLIAALNAANADPDLQFGLVEVCQLPLDGTDLLAYVTQADGLASAWEAQEDKRFVLFLIGAPMDATDAAVKSALQGHQSRYSTVAARMLYQTSASPMPSGVFPRSPRRALAIRCASVSLSEDPGYGGFGELPECFMKGPDGTLSGNENTATIKLGGSKGPGFTVVKAKRGLPYFVRGVTRAGQNSRFVDLGVARMAAFAATVIYEALRRYENPTFDLNPNGTIQEGDAAALEAAFGESLQEQVVRGKHASAAKVTLDRSEKISETRNITVEWSVQTRGQGETITGTLSIVGELSVS